jgi:adenine-specific DNA-methyltransferase
LDDAQGTNRTRKIKTIWDEKELNYQNGKRELKALLGGEAPVDYPKPTALIRKIISLVADSAGVYLDFFAGSGTLAHAVIDANIVDGGTRRYVLIQLPEALEHARFSTIADVCRERVAAHVAATGSSDGFDYYRLERR